MRQGKRVLFIDDDHEDQEIFSLVLNEVDSTIDCLFADNGEQALQALLTSTENRPDYIFLDLNLPYMSGFDCLHAIKEQPQIQDIPVIIYSTSSRETDRQKAKKLGAINYITKPNSMAELRTFLQDIFR